jgi:hypothetical protein
MALRQHPLLDRRADGVWYDRAEAGSVLLPAVALAVAIATSHAGRPARVLAFRDEEPFVS